MEDSQAWTLSDWQAQQGHGGKEEVGAERLPCRKHSEEE